MKGHTNQLLEHYKQLQVGDVPLLALEITQTPHELGDCQQSLRIELLRKSSLSKVMLQFSGVSELKLDRIHPGIRCILEIQDVADAQMEGISYRVFNGEQDFTLSFYCKEFSLTEQAL